MNTTQQNKYAVFPSMKGREQMLPGRNNTAPAQTFANFAQALAGVLVERRASKREAANSSKKD